MALLANVRDSFGVSPRYVYLRSYELDRQTGVIKMMVGVYKDQATRLAFKAAQPAIDSLAAQITTKQVARDNARTAFLELSDEDKAAGRAAFQQAQDTARDEIAALYEQKKEQEAALDANKAGMSLAVPIDPGAVTVGSNGEVLLSDLYTVLATTTFPGATRAD